MNEQETTEPSPAFIVNCYVPRGGPRFPGSFCPVHTYYCMTADDLQDVVMGLANNTQSGIARMVIIDTSRISAGDKDDQEAQLGQNPRIYDRNKGLR